MTEIIPNLYLCSWSETQDYQPKLNAFVVNCTKNLPLLTYNSIRIAVDDDCNVTSINDMFDEYFKIVEIIDQQLSNNKNVIIHCMAGQQRSPSVIAAYLVAKKGYKLVDAIILIRNKRSSAFFWQVNFKDSLERFSSYFL